MEQKMYINFTIDYNGECECVDDFIVNGKEVEILDEVVNPLIKELEKINGFMVSKHRTEVRIWWWENDTMSVQFRYFNEPEDGEFDDYDFDNLKPIEFKYNYMKHLYKNFNEGFFSKCKRKIEWFDKQGLYTMTDNRVVTITLDDIGTVDHYNGYWVEIYNTRNGVIIKKFFRFKDHLTMVHRDKTEYYHVWFNREKLDWYISRPKDTKEMYDVMFKWIDTFQ